MRDKWNAKNNKKEYLKIHIVAVNVKTKKIISMKVIDDEHVNNSKALPELVDEAKKSDKKRQLVNYLQMMALNGNNIFKT
jgi:hypothetical protein